MFLRIEKLNEKKLIGMKIKMSFADNRTHELWRSFMPRKKEIKNICGSELYSVEVYPHGFFDHFESKRIFEKWAVVEVTNYDSPPPQSMEQLIIPEGTYAVFLHKGTNAIAQETYQSIFEKWLPESDFDLDDRPHMAVMGEKYKKDDPSSEEGIWIPVKK